MKILSLIGKVVGVASMLDWTGISPTWGAVIFMASSIAKDVINRIGDYLDDKQMNESYKP